MVGNLTLDISPDTETDYLFQRVGGEGTSFDNWEFGGEFGLFEEKIVPVFEEAIDNTFKEDAPFYFVIPQLCPWEKKPERPLTLEVHLGFNEDRDAYVYETSVDERVALEFEMHRINDGRGNKYTMTSAQVENFKIFATALRELADKIDVELTKTDVEPEKDEDDGSKS
jgi:hypothetical protein